MYSQYNTQRSTLRTWKLQLQIDGRVSKETSPWFDRPISRDSIYWQVKTFSSTFAHLPRRHDVIRNGRQDFELLW